MKTFGLTTRQAEVNKLKGTNELTHRETESFWDMFKESLKDNCLRILMVILAMEVVLYAIGRIWPDFGSDDWHSPVAIFIVIVILAFDETFIDYKLDRVAQTLQKKDESMTPFNEKMDRLANSIGKFGYCVGAVAGIVQVVMGAMSMHSYTFGGIAYLLLNSLVLCFSIIYFLNK